MCLLAISELSAETLACVQAQIFLVCLLQAPRHAHMLLLLLLEFSLPLPWVPIWSRAPSGSVFPVNRWPIQPHHNIKVQMNVWPQHLSNLPSRLQIMPAWKYIQVVSTKTIRRIKTDLWLTRGRGCGGGRDGSLGLADANYYIENGQTARSYCIAQGTLFNIL